MQGYNSTLFVYGQTGTGKTYTMSGTNHEEGIMQRSARLLQHKLEGEPKVDNFSIRMSYIEIYNEKVRDLLSETYKAVREMAK